MATNNYDFILHGFKFRVITSDYDYCKSKSFKYRATKTNIKNAQYLKLCEEKDFVYAEYDCTGSTKVSIDIEIKDGYITIYHTWLKDV